MLAAAWMPSDTSSCSLLLWGHQHNFSPCQKLLINKYCGLQNKVQMDLSCSFSNKSLLLFNTCLQKTQPSLPVVINLPSHQTYLVIKSCSPFTDWGIEAWWHAHLKSYKETEKAGRPMAVWKPHLLRLKAMLPPSQQITHGSSVVSKLGLL